MRPLCILVCVGLFGGATKTSAEPLTSTQPAASRPSASALVSVEVADMQGLDRMAWSRVRTRDGIRYRRAHGGNAFFSVPNFWGQTPTPPPGLYAVEMTHFDSDHRPRPVKLFSGGGEKGYRMIGRLRGTASGELVTDTFLVDAEDMVTGPSFGWSVQFFLARLRPVDLVRVAIRRADPAEAEKVMQRAARWDEARLRFASPGDFTADTIEPGELVLYRTATIEDIAKYRAFKAGKNRDVFRRFDMHYIGAPRPYEQQEKHPATDAEVDEFETMLKAADADVTPQPTDFPFMILALTVRKPPKADVMAPLPASGVAAFTRPIYSPISRVYTKPTVEDLKTPLSLRVARNEWEAGVVLVYTAAAQTGLRLRAGELTMDRTPLKGQVRVKHVTWDKVGTPPLTMARPSYWWPQPESGIETHPDRISMFCLDVLADSDAVPGRYQGHVEVVDSNGRVQARLAVRVDVLAIDLVSPAESDYRLGFFSDVLPTPRMQRTLMEHNCNTFAVWAEGTSPAVRVSRDSQLQLDFTHLDQQLQCAGQLGFGPIVWFLAGPPDRFPHTLDLEKQLLRASLVSQGKVAPARDTRFVRQLSSYYKSNRDHVAPPVENLLGQWCKLVAEHAKTASWPQLALCPMDQPDFKYQHNMDWAKSRYSQTASLVRESSDGRLKVFGLIRQAEGDVLFDDCDLICLSELADEPELLGRVRTEKGMVWGYAKCPFDATFAYGRYLAGIRPMHQRADGVMVWGLEMGRENAWQYVAGHVIPSAGMVGIREGGDDRRYLEAWLRAAPDADAVWAQLDEWVRPIAEAMPREPSPVHLHEYFERNVEHGRMMDQLRQRISERILQAGSQKARAASLPPTDQP